MTAPALVLLAHASRDASVLDVVHGLRKGMQTMRPELTVQVAFLGAGSPSASTVAGRLAKKTDEIVLVPLDLCRAFSESETLDALAARLRCENPGLGVAVARGIGPEASLLNLIDRRLRAALSRQHVTELDGLILSAGDCGDARSASLLQRRARQWSLHHKLPVVTASTHDGRTDIADAVASLWAQGRRHLAVGSWFLTADDDFHLQADVARRAGAVAVAEPFGDEPELLDLALARYVVAAMSLITFDEEEMDAGDPPARHLHVVGA